MLLNFLICVCVLLENGMRKSHGEGHVHCVMGAHIHADYYSCIFSSQPSAKQQCKTFSMDMALWAAC